MGFWPSYTLSPSQPFRVLIVAPLFRKCNTHRAFNRIFTVLLLISSARNKGWPCGLGLSNFRRGHHTLPSVALIIKGHKNVNYITFMIRPNIHPTFTLWATKPWFLVALHRQSQFYFHCYWHNLHQ